MTKSNLVIVAAAALAGAIGASGAWAATACGCLLTTDVDNLGLGSSSGWRFDFRYDDLTQNQLRRGTGTISPAAASRIVNAGLPQKVDQFTKNRYATLGLDYAPSATWGVNLQVPYAVRSHATLGTASDGNAPGAGGDSYDSRTSAIGDVTLIGRYLGVSPKHHIALSFGLKLPTGSHTRTGSSTDPTQPGPVPIDRGLQPGTGTTDVILGAHIVNPIDIDWEYSAQATAQAALGARSGFRPGSSVNLNLGLRYMTVPLAIPQLQLNLRQVARDRGVNADAANTGGTLIYLSPGIALPVGLHASFFGFMQVPVYQRVNGVQLAPRLGVSLGARYAF